jgi:DNA-binding XRE family transcriptional regulator
LGGIAGSFAHPVEQELGQPWRIRLEDSCLQTILRDFSLPERPHEAEEPALGQVIRELREERRLGQGELAVAADVDERRLKALESGQIDADYVLLVRLAKALGVAPGTVVARAEELAGEGSES